MDVGNGGLTKSRGRQMAEKRRGLGRGLGALISGTPSPGAEAVPADDPSVTEARGPNRPTNSGSASGIENELPNEANGSPNNGVSRETSVAATESVSRETNKTGPGSAKNTIGVTEAAGKAADATSTAKSARPVSGSSTAKRNANSGHSSAKKTRPVDMFFAPGPNDEVSERSSEDSSTKKTGTASRSRRVAVPDVLGQVRQTKPDDEVFDNTDDSGPDTSVQRSSGNSALPGYSADDPASIELAGGIVSRETLVPVPGATFAEVEVGEIHPNRKQPRMSFDEDDMAELVHSIREVGLLQPIVVRPSDETGGQRYELVMGERRWRAVQAAGLATIPAIIRDTSNTDLLRDALLENLHRSQLNPLEEAAAYQQLMQEFDCTQDELSEKIGRSRPQISNTIRLMKLPALVQRRVAAGVLSAGHARSLLGLTDVAEMERLAQRIVNEGLSVRATEEIVAMQDGLRRPTKEKTPRSAARHERLDYLATSLSDHLETNVKITLGAKKGRVSIEFGSVDDLNRIMGVIAPSSGD